jgi:hygromycin-B 7''-O-kinase
LAPDPWNDNETVDAVSRVFAAAGLGPVGTIVPLAGGDNSEVFEVNAGGSASPFVLKLYRDDLRWKMAKEVFVYGLLEPRPALPIPTIVAADDSGTVLPQAFLILTKLPGELAAGVLPSIGAADVVTIYRQIGTALRAFHRTTFDSFGYVSAGVIEPHDTNQRYMEHQFAKKLREFAALGGDEEVRRNAEAAVEGSASLLTRCARAVLCHDDVHEANVLVRKEGDRWLLSGILDVENAIAGDPLLDVAKTDYYAVRGDPVKRKALLEGYGPRPPRAEETRRLYRLYHALELWDWFASNGERERLGAIADDIAALSRGGGSA